MTIRSAHRPVAPIDDGKGVGDRGVGAHRDRTVRTVPYADREL